MLKLVGTPLSHFTRKVRIVLHELDLPFVFEPVTDLLSTQSERYRNPLLRVPALIDGGQTLIESDHIVRHIVATRAPGDPLNVLSPDVDDLNRLAVLNGIMQHEVTLILAARGGLDEAMQHGYFLKLREAMSSALAWLDAGLEEERQSFDYVDVATVCMWQHLLHYGSVPALDRFARIARRVARFASRSSVARTAPSTAGAVQAP
jgi:glutathione S-transferase